MTRPVLIVALALATALWVTLTLKAVYQAGWDAHQTRSAAENAARQRATADALLRASDAMVFELGEAVTAELDAQDRLKEIENGQAEDPAVCGISLERMQLLDRIR